MTGRREPVAIVGTVRVLAPNANGYYRLKWTEPDGTPGDTSGGRVLELALTKAEAIDQRVTLAAGPKAVAPLEDVLAAFTESGHSPYKNKKNYKSSQKSQLAKNLHRCLRGYEQHRAMDMTRELCDRMRGQAGTDSMVKSNTTALRALLHWGQQHGYFTTLQAELLPRGCSMPAPALEHRTVTVEATGRPQPRGRVNGQAETYVGDEDAPSRDRVTALSRELGSHFPAWGVLAPELAANSGARWGEQFQLTAHDAHLTGCAEYDGAHLHVDWQIDPAGSAKNPNGRRVRPKGDKTRVVPVPTRSFTGYRLRDALAARVSGALAEQLAGHNLEALLFPAERGGLLWYSSFNSDHLLPAMGAAGWPIELRLETRDHWDRGTQRYRTRTLTRRKAALPWHSLRHRFARICVDVKKMPEGELMAIGGWENIGTVQTRYYHSGRDNMERGLAYFD